MTEHPDSYTTMAKAVETEVHTALIKSASTEAKQKILDMCVTEPSELRILALIEECGRKETATTRMTRNMLESILHEMTTYEFGYASGEAWRLLVHNQHLRDKLEFVALQACNSTEEEARRWGRAILSFYEIWNERDQ